MRRPILAVALVLASAPLAAGADRPNFVFLFADDQRYDAVGAVQREQGDQGRLRDVVNQLEQAGDRAMQACRKAGNVSPQVQQAVQRAHQEASQLKKQIQMG